MQVNILEYFERYLAANGGGATAVIDGAREFSFAELERLSKRCAALLVARVDVVGRPVAVYLPKSAEVIFADLGIVYSGNIYVNMDVKSPVGRIAATLAHINPVAVVTSRALLPQLTACGVDPSRIFEIEDIFEAGPVDSSALWRRLEQRIDTDPLCIINTSGSTGTPKGVTLSHRGTIDFMDWCFERFAFNGSERIGSLSPFHFDIFTLELNLCLARGATLVIIPETAAVFPVKLVEFLAERDINFIFWVPSIMVTIANQGLLKQVAQTSLQTVLFAGEVFPMKQLNAWRRALPKATFVNLYGPIEITVDCTYFILDREFADDEPLPIGFPCRNTDILILNDSNQPCQVGEKGELCVRGSSLALGYWNDPEKTARAFVQNPLNPHYPEPIYRTGDLVYQNARGEIMFVGRKDFQIKHMGYRIELPEIEHNVLAIGGIDNACVLYDERKKEIAVYYETRNSEVTPLAIRKHLAMVFPKAMLPSAFHRLPALPLNANGKIDRNGLRLQCSVAS